MATTESFVRLKTTLLGTPMVAFFPEVRYGRWHEIVPAPEALRFGNAVRDPSAKTTTWRHAEDGQILSSPVRIGTWARSEDGIGPVRMATGERYAWRQGGERGVCSELLGPLREAAGSIFPIGGVILASDDPDVAALIAEVDALDAAWRVANAGAIAYEDETQRQVAAAVALDGLGRRELPRETECLECGATYDAPGHVEAGGMGCDRCNGVRTGI